MCWTATTPLEYPRQCPRGLEVTRRRGRLSRAIARAPDAVVADADHDEDEEEEEAGDNEEEKIGEEPLSELVERLDATVFGLIEALDADRADLPQLLDEALKGSLWARQIKRESDGVEEVHRMVFQARANLIWSTTTPQARKGHFAMSVGLEAGLRIDAMAEELSELLDRADAAALPGEVDALANSLAGLAERLLVMRPFIPDKKNALPRNWRAILKQWVSGAEVTVIGPQNMKVVEEAFTYRLVWALEAIRTRRMTLGWSPDRIAGGAAAALETGVPPVHDVNVDPRWSSFPASGHGGDRERKADLRDASRNARFSSRSDEITAFTDAGDWPTPDTAALWARFRTEALSGGIQKWSVERYRRLLDVPAKSAPFAGLYRRYRLSVMVGPG